MVSSPLFRLGRALFGGLLAFVAVDGLRTLDERTGDAEPKGVPFPNVSVSAGSADPLLGGVGIALWCRPAPAAVASFFVTMTPLIHDLRAVNDPEQEQQAVFKFPKNTALLGAALAFLRIGRRTETATRGSVPSAGGRPRRADRFVPVSGPFLTA